jgi:hypothetical protein
LYEHLIHDYGYPNANGGDYQPNSGDYHSRVSGFKSYGYPNTNSEDSDQEVVITVAEERIAAQQSVQPLYRPVEGGAVTAFAAVELEGNAVSAAVEGIAVEGNTVGGNVEGSRRLQQQGNTVEERNTVEGNIVEGSHQARLLQQTVEGNVEGNVEGSHQAPRLQQQLKRATKKRAMISAFDADQREEDEVNQWKSAIAGYSR